MGDLPSVHRTIDEEPMDGMGKIWQDGHFTQGSLDFERLAPCCAANGCKKRRDKTHWLVVEPTPEKI